MFAGEMTKEEHQSGRDEAIRVLTDDGLGRLLVDARTIDARMSAVDDFKFTQEHESSGLLSVRIAVIHRADESERFRFIENVAVNRGVDMKVFTDPDQALGWLTAK